MHAIWTAGHIIGFFHGPSVIVIFVMTCVGSLMVYIFWKVFRNEFLEDA
jgi:hypothetical protein